MPSESASSSLVGPDVARALADDVGPQVLNPPSTLVIVIATDGTVTLTEFGHTSAEALVELTRGRRMIASGRCTRARRRGCLGFS